MDDLGVPFFLETSILGHFSKVWFLGLLRQTYISFWCAHFRAEFVSGPPKSKVATYGFGTGRSQFRRVPFSTAWGVHTSHLIQRPTTGNLPICQVKCNPLNEVECCRWQEILRWFRLKSEFVDIREYLHCQRGWFNMIGSSIFVVDWNEPVMRFGIGTSKFLGLPGRRITSLGSRFDAFSYLAKKGRASKHEAVWLSYSIGIGCMGKMEVLGAPKNPKAGGWFCMLLQGNVSSNHLFGRLQLCTDYLTLESFEYTSDQTSNWNHSEKTLDNIFSVPKTYQTPYLAWPRADAADFGFGLVFGAVTKHVFGQMFRHF